MSTPVERVRSWITDRPVAILMVFIAAVVFGALSYGRLPVQLMPELSYPTVTVRTEYSGAAPEEVENDISRPIEEELGVISGLRRISSISRAGVSDVVLEFAWDTDMSGATQDVLEKLDLVFLPDESARPLILHYDPSLDPVLELSLSGTGARFEGEQGLRRLRRLAELQIKKQLDPVKGIAAVRVRGGLEEEIQVNIDEEALRRTGLSIQQVIDRLAQENINVAGGTLQEGRTEYLVRTLNEYVDVQQIRDTIVARIEGRAIRVRDLGTVEWSHVEREILTRTDGHPSVQIDIYKEGDANIVALAQRVRTMLGDFDPAAAAAAAAAPAATGQGGGRRGPPPGAAASGLVERVWKDEGAELSLVADRSLFIKSSIDDVRNTAILGGLLAILVLYLFLRNVTSTAIVAVSIPFSLLITFAPLNLLGVSLNIMSLGGLALGIGMLVDSSIVVLESIFRCREEGDDGDRAAIRGTGEVRGAVFASTLTSIAVFFPMVFVEGLAGQAFGDLGLAVVVSLLASAAVALFFIPMLAARTSLGMSVVAAVILGLLGWVAAAAAPQVLQAALGLVLVTLAIGLLYVIVLRIAGRLDADQYSRRATGLWRWIALQRLRRSSATPIRMFRALLVPRGSGARKVGHIVLWPLAALVGLCALALGYVYLFVFRFLIGSVLEWGVGKPIVMAVLGATSLVTRFVVPAIAAVFRYLSFLPVRATGWLLERLNTTYPRVVRSALRHAWVVVLVVVACFWLSWQVVTTLDSELLPEVHQGEFTVEVALPVGTPIEETERLVAPIEKAILEEREHIASLILTVGFDSENMRRSDEGEHTAAFKVLLDDAGRDAAVEEAVVARLRERFAGVPDLDARIVRPVLFSAKTPIEVEVHGFDLRDLKRYGDEAAAAMAAMPQLADVESTLRRGAPEVQIVYDRDRLATYGMNIRTVAELVRDKVKGYEATRFNLTDRRIPILVRLALDDRETVSDVSDMIINPGEERPIPLSAVADVTLGDGPSEVRRIDGRRVAVVSANVAEGSLSAASAAIADRLQRAVDWPDDMTFFIAGQNEEWERSQRSLWIALALSVFLVYVIMAAQFESLVHPLVIMLTIPLAFVGTVVTLKVLGLSLSVVVFLGMIMLAGIVVNNAIVLVDYINTLRRRGVERDEAIVTAGTVRLRPILMTTATTVLGLLPMALGWGDGAEIRTPMAIAVISGLISSTLLTLIVIPSIYRLVDDLIARLFGANETVPRDAEVPAGAKGAQA